jgi:Flp pilus assembly protein TadG
MKGESMKKRSLEKGSAAVEFALCFLLVFLIAYSVMEFARAAYAYTVLAGATREAARYAVVHGSKSGSPATQTTIEERVERWAVGLNSSALTVNTTWTPSNSPGSKVRVDASYSVAPFTRLILSQPLTLSSRSELVISQ